MFKASTLFLEKSRPFIMIEFHICCFLCATNIFVIATQTCCNMYSLISS